MSAGKGRAVGRLSFRRIIDIPFETCVAALENWQRTGQDGELRIGPSLLRGPIEHDRDSGTCKIEVCLARGLLRRPSALTTSPRASRPHPRAYPDRAEPRPMVRMSWFDATNDWITA